MNLFKKHPVLGIVIAIVAIGAIFLIRSLDDKVNAETTISEGQKLYKVEKYAEAIPYFNSAIELDASNYKAYFSRGLCYKAQENYKKALKDYNKAIELSPKSDLETLYYTRGLIKYDLGMDKSACKDMDEAAKRGSTDAEYFMSLYCN